jgi:hypothetical protein
LGEQQFTRALWWDAAATTWQAEFKSSDWEHKEFAQILPIQAEESKVADVLEVHTSSLKPWPEVHGGEAPPKRESSTAKAQHTHQLKQNQSAN